MNDNSNKPMQFISMEVEKSQVMIDDPTRPGKKTIVQQPSGFVTIKARVMAEHCHDDDGRKLTQPTTPGDEWQPFTITLYRRRQRSEIQETDPNAN